MRNAPGSTTSTRTPSGPTSAASAAEYPSSANFVARYAENPGYATCPPHDESHLALVWRRADDRPLLGALREAVRGALG